MDAAQATTRVATFCPLCVSRCGATAVVSDGAFVALEPDPSHPTGAALCVKGRAAPEIARHPERLLYPLKRTNPKGATDPGWQPISWDEALDTIASTRPAGSRPVMMIEPASSDSGRSIESRRVTAGKPRIADSSLMVP